MSKKLIAGCFLAGIQLQKEKKCWAEFQKM